MPPKRKQSVVDLVSESELEDESDDELDLNNSLKFIQRIEALAKKRNDKRNAITAGFDKFIADTKGRIEKHYVSKAEKRSAEIKDLLTRRAQALQKRAAIECEIKALISQGRKDTHDIMVILEEVQFYKYRKSSTTAGSLASLISSRAIPAHSTGPIVTPPNATGNRAFDLPAWSQKAGGENGGHVQSASITTDTRSLSTLLSKTDFFDYLAG